MLFATDAVEVEKSQYFLRNRNMKQKRPVRGMG